MIDEIFDIPVILQGEKISTITCKIEGMNEIEEKVDRMGQLLCELRELAQSLSETTITASVVPAKGED